METRRAALFAFLVVAGGACGGGKRPLGPPPEPHLIPGGGIADGPLRGQLNVYVIDEDTRNVLSSASVRVGPADALEPCVALTDSTGLVRFVSDGASSGDGGAPSGVGCKLLDKPATLTVSASGHAPSTWIGVDGSNLTIALRAISAPALGRATVMGTIAGWDTRPAPAANHNTLAFVAASNNPDLTDRANNIDQGTRAVEVVGTSYTIDIAANACIRTPDAAAFINDCDWVLTTHTGPQAIYAILLDQDTNGTDMDNTDDTITLIGWAIKTGQTFGDNTMTGAVSLPMIADADMQSFSATFASGPSGLDYIVAYPVLDLGTDGRITIFLPTLDSTSRMTRVPKLVGPLAGARYDMIASAIDDPTKPLPATVTLLRSVNPSATVAVPSWMPPPTAIAMTSGTFSFAPVADATLHAAELQTPDGQRRWAITIFDGTTSFTLPGLSPDPLPIGMIRYGVSALKIPGADLQDIVFSELGDVITDISSDEITYSR